MACSANRNFAGAEDGHIFAKEWRKMRCLHRQHIRNGRLSERCHVPWLTNRGLLLTLDVQKKHFQRFTNMLLNWHTDEKKRSNINYLLIFLINTFPKEMAANSDFSTIITKHWASMFTGINTDKFEIFIDEYVAGFIENRFPDVDKHLASIILDTSKQYNAPYMTQRIFLDKYDKKEDRFKILGMLQKYKVTPILLGYGADGYQSIMKNQYPVQENTDQENTMLSTDPTIQ